MREHRMISKSKQKPGKKYFMKNEKTKNILKKSVNMYTMENIG